MYVHIFHICMWKFYVNTEKSGNSQLWKVKIGKENFHTYFIQSCEFDLKKKALDL